LREEDQALQGVLSGYDSDRSMVDIEYFNWIRGGMIGAAEEIERMGDKREDEESKVFRRNSIIGRQNLK
jgi:hypothetical protein